MGWKKVLRPNLIKIVAAIIVFLLLYFFFTSTIRIIYDCKIGGDVCLKEVQKETNRIVLQDTVMVGIPISIIIYIFIGFLQNKKNKNN